MTKKSTADWRRRLHLVSLQEKLAKPEELSWQERSEVVDAIEQLLSIRYPLPAPANPLPRTSADFAAAMDYIAGNDGYKVVAARRGKNEASLRKIVERNRYWCEYLIRKFRYRPPERIRDLLNLGDDGFALLQLLGLHVDRDLYKRICKRICDEDGVNLSQNS